MVEFVRKRITEMRIAKGVSEYQMSYDLGHSRGYVNNISSGKSVPSLKEFADCEGIETSVLDNGKRTKAYYCHPYSSYERGSNEVCNRLVRRKIPKGVNFDNKTEEEIQEVEDWINDYPREIFGFQTARERFEMELSSI